MGRGEGPGPARLVSLAPVSIRDTIRAVVAGTLGYEAALDALSVAPPDEVDAVLAAALHDAFGALFRGGWQPVELHRFVARRGEPAHARLVVDAVAAHLREHPPATVDERWRAQAGHLGAHVWWGPAYLRELAERWHGDRVAALDTVLALLVLLAPVPPVAVLVPPPGTAVAPGPRHAVDSRVLDRVRALLAKAESTQFPAEAQAYTAKAQEMVARHSIDAAVLAGRDVAGAAVVPLARRIGVDHPYEAEQASLLDAVAAANRCHTVWSPEWGFATVFGFDADIDAVELVHTSLLVQAHRAMARGEPAGGKAGRKRLKAFRRSFLVAFAVRIGERLAEAADAALAEAARTADPATLLPVLASRDAEVRQTMQRMFPRTGRARGGRVDSWEGWDSGRAAADRAGLRPPT